MHGLKALDHDILLELHYPYKLGMWSPEVSARVRREGLAGRVMAASGIPVGSTYLHGWRCFM
jgi:hypothetical protein